MAHSSLGACTGTPLMFIVDMSETDMSAPMKPAVFHVLLALADGDLHGYAIMQAVRDQSDGRVPLRTGSFYRHLAVLIDAGLVAEAPAPRGTVDPRRGTHYRLTTRGRQALADERQRLRDLLALVAPQRLAARPGAR